MSILIESINVMSTWIAAKQALAALGIKPQSLYANVSRGRIRAKTDPRDSRRSLYHRQDVERVAKSRAGRQSRNSVAAEAIRWGAPVLSSSITTVIDERLYYRGQNALTLSTHASYEQVCECLWQTQSVRFEPARDAVPPTKAEHSGLTRALLVLAELAGQAPPSMGRSNRVLTDEAMLLVSHTISALMGLCNADDDPLHLRLAKAWSKPQAAQSIRCALILLADHELNASTFATRVAISTGAPLAAGLLAGLSTLMGPRHGGASGAMESLAQNAYKAGAHQALHDWLNTGQRLPAFGHPLYSRGDPRARALLATIDLPPMFSELQIAAESLTGDLPNIDFAMTAMAHAYELPVDAPFKIFATARLAGWVAHALEQSQTGELIRPRAQYIGTKPVSVKL